MGIQGMTNWKFSAFLTIALMLVAGLFSTTAMAAANDGHGTMTVAVTLGGAGQFQQSAGTPGQADYRPQILFANEAGYTLAFTYTATKNMQDGKVEITIPGDNWKIPFTSTGGSDSITITQAGATSTTLYVKGSSHTSSNDDNELVEITKSGDDVTKVIVNLKGAGWNPATGATQAFTITFTSVTSAIPRSLYVPDVGYPYREYTFRTRTMAKDGALRSLVIPATGDDAGKNPQPIVRVGNVKNGKGKIKVSPIVYQGEEDRHIQLVFTAAGPMYDVDGNNDGDVADVEDIDSRIVITVPTGLGTKPSSGNFPNPMLQIDTADGDEYVSISRVTGTVQFANPNQRILPDPNNSAVATVNITRMEYNAKIYVSYRKVDVNSGLDSAQNFIAASASGAAGTTESVTFDPDGTAGKQHVRLIAGSGEIELTDGSDAIVPMSSTRKHNLVFTYKAATKLTNATLVISQPNDSGWNNLTFVTSSAKSRENNYVSTSGGGDVVVDLNGDTAGTPDTGSAGGAITLTGLDLDKNGSFTVSIHRSVLATTADNPAATIAGAYGWPANLNTTAVSEPMLYVVNVNDDVEFDVLNTAGDAIEDLPHYAAASERNIRFRFTIKTPIKGGGLRFQIPNGWRQPSDTDVAGKARVKLLSTGEQSALVDKYGPDDNVTFSTSGNQISVKIKTLNGTAAAPMTVTIQYGNGTGDMQGMVQRNAKADLEIIGHFSTGVSSTYYSADSPVLIRIGNVEDGSGTATATSSPAPAHSVEAGSKKNTITVRFMAAGTMNGGQVRVGTPTEWGNLQETDATKDNYIRVNASRSMVNQDAIAYGEHHVLVPLTTAAYGNTVEFVLSNVEAQKKVGLAQFTVESAGGGPSGSSGTLTLLKGEPLPKDKDDKNITDPYLLLGKVYVPHIALTTSPDNSAAVRAVTGRLRLEVVAGAGGTGEAELLEIVRSDSGLRNYLNKDGEPAADRQVHAGDNEIYLVFKYTPVQTIEDGALRFTVPNDWSPPQEESSNVLGYTEIAGADGEMNFVGRVLTIPSITIDSSSSIEIHYGVGSLGAEAPDVMKTSKFEFEVKGTSGAFKSIGTADVKVRSQASGRGSVSVATGMKADDGTATAYAGDEGVITITYAPIGEIDGGSVKLTVPEALVGKGGVMKTSGITASKGSAMYGGDESDANLKLYGITKNDVLVSGVDLNHNDTFTFTYTGPIPAAKGDISFNVAVDGGAGPDEVKTGVNPIEVEGSPLTVTVIDAKPGSGSVAISPTPGSITGGSTGNAVVITYTAAGEIGEGKKITVTVPAGWSAPLNEAADPTKVKMGTFTVGHILKPADDGTVTAGDAVTAKLAKAAATDTVDTVMVAEVASGKKIAAEDAVVFTYVNATAPTTLGPSVFETSYDGIQVGTDDDVEVIVQSTEGATTLGIESADSFTIEGDPLKITVKLMAADGSVATRSEATTVTLTSDSATGSFTPATVTIAAGKYEATSAYSDTAVARATLTASTTATGIAAGTKMVTADTDNLSISTVTFAPMYAMVGDTVTVTAMATPLQTAMFSVGTIVTAGTMTEGEPGAYSGSFDVVAEHHADGMYSVTVSINGTSKMADAQLTIDSTAPTVTAASASAAMVANGDTVTITATASDNNSVEKVEADVSALDDTQGMVELAMGDDGSYSAEVTISADNGASNGAKTVSVTATDMAGNMSDMASVEITLQNSISFTSMIPTGANLFHVPLNDPDITTVGDLRTELGDAVSSIIIRRDGGWDPDPDDVMVTSDLGIYLVATVAIEHTFEGDAWEDTTVNLESGANLVGLPVNDPSVTMASDISGLFADGVVLSITAGSGGQYTQISEASDIAIAGDAAYYIVAGDVTGGKGTATLTGDGWANGDAANAAPIALSGYRIESQTPALAVYGSVTDEITGLAKEGFRVKVKNLTTKIGLSELTSVETADGYSMAFVDLKDARAARIGDILEISADSPTPLIGVKPVRHVVTVDDVKNGRITLEDLIAYEIPAETELLRNYPNPFNPETWIPYHLSEDADVKLTIYDVNGALVRDIDVGHQTAAKYDTRAKAIYWDGRNQFGEQVASGIYFYSLEAGDFSATRKMVILK